MHKWMSEGDVCLSKHKGEGVNKTVIYILYIWYSQSLHETSSLLPQQVNTEAL